LKFRKGSTKISNVGLKRIIKCRQHLRSASSSLEKYDLLVRTSFEDILKSKFVNDNSWKQCSLPVSHGGFGLRLTSHHCCQIRLDKKYYFYDGEKNRGKMTSISNFDKSSSFVAVMYFKKW